MAVEAADFALEGRHFIEGGHNLSLDALLLFSRDESHVIGGLLLLELDDPLDRKEGQVFVLFQRLELLDVFIG